MPLAAVRTRLRAIAGVVALTIACGAGGLSAEAAGPSRSALTMNSVTVSAWPGNQGSLTPGQDLVIQVSVRNDSSEPIESPTASAYLERSPITSVDQLTEWLNPETLASADEFGSLVAQAQLETIAPGATVALDLAVPSASVGLGTSARNWGAREVGVRLSTQSGDVGQARTALVWNATPAFTPVKVAVAVPLTVPVVPDGLIPADELVRYTSSNGLLSRQLDAVAGRPVAIGIDPMILASIRILGSETPPSALAWLDRLENAPNETFALAYADADLTLLTQAGFPSVPVPESFDFAVDPNRFSGSVSETPSTQPSNVSTDDPNPTVTPSPAPTADPDDPILPTLESLIDWPHTFAGFGWPADNSVVASDLPRLTASGITTMILDQGNVDRDSTGTANTAASLGDQTALVVDSTISDLLRAASDATTTSEFNDAVPQLSAALATIARERSASPTIVLATFDRGWPGFGSHRAETIDLLSAFPWTAAAPLSEAASTPGAPTQLVDRAHSGDRVGRAHELFTAIGAENQFATVVDDPTTITAPRRVELLGRMSVAWGDDLASWNTESATFLADSTSLLSSVQLVESSTINLLADRGSLPITVQNALGQPVTVYVTVRPLKALLAVQDQRVEVTIDPDSQRKALVPVQSVSNGEVRIEVILTSGTGARIGEPTYVDINVQAGWETVGTVIATGLVVLIFGLGLVRNIVKRRRDRGEVTAESGEAASSPVETAPDA